MSTDSTNDFQARWTFLGREMGRRCDHMDHHFRCVAGEVKFLWLIKNTMFASINDFPRLVIGKVAAKPQKMHLAGFAIHLYLDENTLAESYILTIDENMMCSLTDTEKRVPVREMCQRFLNALCTPCSNPTLTSSLQKG